jgi:hypothetical protein
VIFLRSYRAFAQDRIPVLFVVTRRDLPEFERVILPECAGLNVSAVTLEDVLKETVGIEEDPDGLLKRIGKFNYQSIKKLYGAVWCGAEAVLVLDSENVCVKPFALGDLIARENERKRVIFGSYTLNDITAEVTANAERLLGIKANGFYFQTPYWLYRRDILLRLLDSCDVYHDLTHAIPHFEGVIYYLFLQKIGGFNFVCLDRELTRYMGFDVPELMRKNLTTAEYICKSITMENIEPYCRFLNDFQIPIARLHGMSEECQKVIISGTPVQIGTFQG